MERIHRKSALTETSDLLLSAHECGAELLWQRYEQQLPLCAFTGNGLNCRKCFQGPCRINPFGDEPSRGVCGADRDQIVMETLFQATLEGVMESARTLQISDSDRLDQELPDIASEIPSRAAERLSAAGLLPVRRSDLFRVQNSFFSHRGYLSQTLKGLTRLGLIHYGFLRLGEASLAPAQAESAFDSQGINLLIVGQAPTGLMRALEQLAREVEPETYQAFELYAVHRQPVERVARLLGMTPNAIYISKTRMLKRLREVLGNLMDAEG